MIPEVDRILSQFGIGGGYRRVTLGRGAVGKSTSAFLALCGVLGIVGIGLAWAGYPEYLIGLAAIAALVFWYFQRSIMNFAKENPAAALLEGADWVKWHQAETSAKDVKIISNAPSIPDPQNPIQVEHLSHE